MKNAPIAVVGAFDFYRSNVRVGDGNGTPRMFTGVGKTYGARVGSTISMVGSGVTIAMVGYGVGVNVGVGVRVIVAILVGSGLAVGADSSIVVALTSAAGIGSGGVTRTSVTQRQRMTSRNASAMSAQGMSPLRCMFRVHGCHEI